MFTENEISHIIENPEILEAVQQLKNDFRKKEAPYLEISDHDFFSLIMMMPSVGIALANGAISLIEEMSLNKKARKVSKGGYFRKKDPVVYAMKFLIKNAANWEDRFYEVIRLSMEKSFDMNVVIDNETDAAGLNDHDYKKLLCNSPYIFIRFLHSFFWDDDHENLTESRRISKVEFDKVGLIGEKLGLDKTLIFRKFLDSFDVK